MATFRPPQKIKVSDWVEKEIHLPKTVAHVSGRISLYEYQKGIIDAVADPSISRVTVQKSARIGYSTVLIGLLAHYVVNDPSLILLYLPDEGLARSIVTSDIEPIFEESPALKKVLSGDKPSRSGKKDRSTMLMRQFTGGSMKVLSAETDRSFRAHNGRIIILDEVDSMKVIGDGHPVDLAVTRADTFPDSKLILGSSPVCEETSHVISEYAKSDQRIFEVPCPHCGSFHEIKWGDIKWPEGHPEKAAWWCPSCGTETHNDYKAGMIAKGRWRITKPEVKGHAGFKINSLSSPIPKADWRLLAQDWVKAQGDPTKLQVFINTRLGQGWSSSGDRIDELALMQSAEQFGLGREANRPFPPEVLMITAGIDMQDDRGEISYVGWSENGQQFILDHDVVYGSYQDNAFWTDIDSMIRQKWRHPLGGEIGIDAIAIDSSSGSHMPHVYEFVKPRLRRRVVAIKGDGGRRKFIERSKTMKKDPLWIVGTDPIKDTLLNRLQMGNIIRFSADLPEVWFEQFTGEQSVVKMDRGRPVRKWIPVPGRRNEALDCVVYATAVKELVPINWQERREQLSSGFTVVVANDNQPADKPRVRQSGWL